MIIPIFIPTLLLSSVKSETFVEVFLGIINQNDDGNHICLSGHGADAMILSKSIIALFFLFCVCNRSSKSSRLAINLFVSDLWTEEK